LDEISIIVTPQTLRLKSYVDDSKVSVKVLHTELSLDPNDFEEFQVTNDAQITFCLKDFKAILGFCDTSGQPVILYFERGGRPICLSVKYFGVFESDFVLATLLEPTSQQSASTSGTGSASTGSSQTSNSTQETALNRKRKVQSPSPIQSWTPSSKPVDSIRNFTRTPKSPITPKSPVTPHSSDNAVITSGSSASQFVIKSTSGSQINGDNSNAHDETEDFLGADYEDEVDGSPQPPAKKMALLSAEEARMEIHSANQMDMDNKEESETIPEEEDDEEISCSVEE